MEVWRFIDSGLCEPPYNMAMDEALMRCVSTPVLRFYGWEPPAVSLGYFQPASEVEEWLKAGYPVVRRATGGGAIYHFAELTYCLVLPRGHRLAESTKIAYDEIHGAIIEALQSLGVPAKMRGHSSANPPHTPFCFNRTIYCDIVAEGKKIAGSAQRRTSFGFLQHGSIPIGKNPLTPNASFVKSYTPRADYGTVVEAIIRALTRRLKVVFRVSQPTWREEQTAASLITIKYANNSWTFKR